MDDVIVRQFERKAPLVDPEEMADLVVEELVTDELRRRADALWFRGSFADPEREIDSNETPSDMDLFVTVPGWDLPIADTGIVLYSSQGPTPLIDELEDDPTEDTEWKHEHHWESPDAAWERVPEYARQTLVNFTQRFFRARPEDVERNLYREYDPRIGSPDQLEYFPASRKARDL